MKTLFFFLLVSFSGFLYAQNITSAVGYNDYIVDLQNEIGEKMLAFNEHVGDENSTLSSSTPYFEDMLKTTRDVIKRLEKLPVWENNHELKNAALKLFRFYEVTIDRDYRRMLGIIFDAEGMTPETLEELEQILSHVTTEEGKLDADFQRIQNEFAEKYDFLLEENEIQEKIDKY